MRRSARDENNEFVDNLSDPVELGPRAHLQVRQVFWRCGLRQMPATWGELVGNQSYCQLMVGLWLTLLDGKESPDFKKDMMAHHDKRHPGHSELLILLASGDTDGAWAWHRAHKTFEANAVHPMYTKDRTGKAPA